MLEDEEWFVELVWQALQDADEDISEDTVARATQVALEVLADQTYETMINDRERIRKQQEINAGFVRRLRGRWGRPLELLDILIYECTALGQVINTSDRPDAAEEQDLKFEALIQLHSRACQIAREISVLLREGFPDGALARWRSLHEIAVVMRVIQKQEAKTAERFLAYRFVQDHELAKAHNQYAQDLESNPIDDEVMTALRNKRVELAEHYDSFEHGHRPGWIGHVIESPSFGDLEKEAGAGHLRPYYKLASQTLHGGPKGTLDRIGLLDLDDAPNRPNVMLVGPSNAGLNLPGKLTAFSLTNATASLANRSLSPNRSLHPSRIAQLLAIEKLSEEVKSAFEEEAEILIEDEREILKERSDMDIIDIALVYLGHRELITSAFIREHTEFSSVEAFEEALPGDTKLKDIDNLRANDAVQVLVERKTAFNSLDEMVEQAFTEWVQSNAGLNLGDD